MDPVESHSLDTPEPSQELKVVPVKIVVMRTIPADMWPAIATAWPVLTQLRY